MNNPGLIIIKGAIFRAWRINLYRPDVTAPIPAHIWRAMGAA
jgi:hypothetical protein